MAKKKKKTEAAGEELSFEESLAELEGIVGSLEGGQHGLGESLALYERGVKLLKGCQGMLERVERRIEVLTGFDAQGNPVTRPLDEEESDDSGDLEAKKSARAKRRGSGSKSPGSRKASRDDVDDTESLF